MNHNKHLGQLVNSLSDSLLICVILFILFLISNYRGFSQDLADKYRVESTKKIQSYTEEIEADPNNILAYYNRGMAKYNLEDFRGAILDYSKVIELNSSYYNDKEMIKKGDVFIWRAHSKANLKEYQGALQDYLKSLELNPENASNPYHPYRIGECKFNLNDYRGAILEFNKAIKLDSKFREAFIQRGFSKLNLNDKEGGCLDFSKAGELGDPKAYNYISKYCN